MLLIVLISPFWLLENFHTGDGPAHLYSAYVLHSLLAEPDSFYISFFQLHLHPVPNAVVQLLLAGCLTFASSVYAVKIVLTLVIIIFVRGYSSMVKTMSGEVKTFPLAIMLLIYCYPLRMGLYSFILGLGVMMFAISYYIRSVNNGQVKTMIIFSMLLLITWFCHLFALAVLLLFVFVYEVIFVSLLVYKKQPLKQYLQNLFKKTVAILPVIILTILFLRESINVTNTIYIEKSVLKRWFFDLEVMYNFGTDDEFIIRKLFYILIISAIAFLASNKTYIKSTLIYSLGFATCIFLLFYFLMPANLFSGGSINLRFAYLILIMICVFIDMALMKGFAGYFKMLMVGVGVYVSCMNEYEMLKPSSDDMKEVFAAKDHIRQNAIVLPLNYLHDNFQYNFLLYLGCDKKILVLDNAEAATPNGLITWRKDFWQPELIGNYLISNSPFIHPNSFEKKVNYNIDYIVRWCWKETLIDSTTQQTNALIDSLYAPVYSSVSGKVTIFERRN